MPHLRFLMPECGHGSGMSALIDEIDDDETKPVTKTVMSSYVKTNGVQVGGIVTE